MGMKKIMVVDDESDHTRTVKQVLESSGDKYKVICVDSGEKCLELLEKDQIPDLILLDIRMPEMSGWLVLDKLKENASWEKIPIILLTARTDELAENAGGFLGDDFIVKPYDIDDLEKRIDKILKKQ
jgi:putative two-component system response regulator